MSNGVEEVKNAIKNNTLVIGKDKVLKMLKAQKISKVFLSSNVSEAIKSELEDFAKLAEISIEVLPLPNEEVKILCKQQFLITVLGIMK